LNTWPTNDDLKRKYSLEFTRLPKEKYIYKRFPNDHFSDFDTEYLRDFEEQYYCLQIDSEVKGDMNPTKVVKNDKDEDGLSTFWYKNGQKRFETTYKDGKIISQKSWNKDGSVKN